MVSRWTTAFLFALGCLSGALAVDDPDVIVLGEDNFDEVVNKEDLILVEFYAPWCGHCKHLAPEYALAATDLLKHDPPIPLAKVDATEHGDLASRFEVRGYPTLKVFRKGNPSAYEGPRDHEGIVSYMEKQAQPAVKEIADADALAAFTDTSRDVKIVGFFNDGEGAAATAFRSFADARRADYTCGIVTDAALVKEAGEGVTVFKTNDEDSVQTDAATTEEIAAFVDNNIFPSVGQLKGVWAARYAASSLPKVVAKNDNPKQVRYFRSRLGKVAPDFAGKALFYIEENYAPLENFGLAKKKAGIVIEAQGRRYALTDKISVDNMRTFVNQFFDGELQPHIKSAPIPDEPTEDGVTVVVGKTFDDIVMDPTKDVLIEFYAPWCGHCKSLAPIYADVATRLEGNPDVVIAKIDATANDYPDTFAVRGYPTIFFAKADGTILSYDGAREEDAFVQWLSKKATTKFTLTGKEEL